MSVVAANVRRIIDEKGYKHSAVARRAHMKPQSLSDMLNGRKLIRAEHIPLLAKALDAEPNDLFQSPEK